MEDLNITNRFVFLVMDIPIYTEGKSGTIDDLRKRLHLIKEKNDILKDFLENEVVPIIKVIAAVFPDFIFRYLLWLQTPWVLVCL